MEAKIELGELDDEVLGYWNAVRNRGGVPDIETVYPDVKSDQNLARDLIHRERQVEFAFENIRWFDANRWKIATETNHGKTYGMNVNISSKNALRSEYYQRTGFRNPCFPRKTVFTADSTDCYYEESGSETESRLVMFNL